MKNTVNTLFRTALPRYGKRSVFFLTLIAVPVLLILLGQSELLSVENEWAACSRIISIHGQLGGNNAAWQPDNYSNVIFSKIICMLSNVFPLSEWVIRVPAVLAALILLSGTMVLALEIADRKTAVMAGWLLLSSYGFLYWGRVGSGQMFAAAALVWTAVLFYSKSHQELFSFRRGLDFCFIFLLTLLACGSVAAVGIICFMLPQWYALGNTHKISLRSLLLALLGCVTAYGTVLVFLLAVIYASGTVGGLQGSLHYLWYILRQILGQTLWEFLPSSSISFVENIFHLPRLMLPWTLFIPAAVYSLWKKRSELSPEHKRFIMGIVLFLGAGVFPTRRWGVMLPVLGPALILLSMSFSVHFRAEKLIAVSERIVRGLFIIAAALVMALPCSYPLWNELLHVSPPLLLFLLSAVTGLVTLLILTYCISRRNPAEKIVKRLSPVAGTVLAGVCLSIFVNCVLFPEMSVFRTARRFWIDAGKEIEQYNPTLDYVVFYKMDIPDPAIFYLNLNVPFKTVSSMQEMGTLLKSCGGKVAVISRKALHNKKELEHIVKHHRRRIRKNAAALVEDNPVAFVSADHRSTDKSYALWILEF